MFFSKSFIAAATVLLGFTLQVHAHAGVTPALGVTATFARANVQRPSIAKPCGKINVAQTLDTSTPITANADGTFVATITNFNAGIDGSRQVTAKVDGTGVGKTFTAATVTQNGDKSPTNVGSQQLTVALPEGMTCTGGATKNKCLVSFKTAGGFGNCAVVQTAAAAGANTAAAATGKKAKATARDVNAVGQRLTVFDDVQGSRAARHLRLAEQAGEAEDVEDEEEVDVDA
ncbi:hypothetical protein TRAPUB_1573 [Trametes pubescens]|uniref:Uncharacterized protein n=1 Tax=Trametes pubescens TaxID=154538 RepID=A0A1M2VIZ8_TRAPU|nr:hypothetical protein TRAPUB_1573 [Trametes pubescens]